MSGFNAGSVVKPLNWNFRPFAQIDGCVPEPSQEAVELFFEQLQAITRKAKVIEEDATITSAQDADAALELAENDSAKVKQIARELEEALAELCNGSPTLEEIRSVGYRPRMAFSRWLMGELRPEA